MEFFIKTTFIDFLIDAEVYCDFCHGDNVTPPGGHFEMLSWKLIDISYPNDDIDVDAAVDYINDLMETSDVLDQVYEQWKNFTY
jgi:hypothetical protein